jgi:hypothetical protein
VTYTNELLENARRDGAGQVERIHVVSFGVRIERRRNADHVEVCAAHQLRAEKVQVGGKGGGKEAL